MKIEINPIGKIHSPFKEPEGMPIQPTGADGVQGTVEIFDKFQAGLKDLDGFSHISTSVLERRDQTMAGHALSTGDRCATFEDLGLRDYVPVLDLQTTAREEMIQDPVLGDRVLFVQHPAVYTLGKRGGRENLVVSERFLAEKGIEIVQTARGGTLPFTGRARLCFIPSSTWRDPGSGWPTLSTVLKES